MSNDISNSDEWNSNHEKILVEWSDKAICYQWLHTRSHCKFSKSNALFTIPVIIMSTITGTANFAQDRFSPSIKPYIPIIIGSINIFAGILTTIQQYLKISELNEAHRVASIAWGKFYRNSKVELSKSPKERNNVSHMLKQSKEEFDRLIETSPDISQDVIIDFKNTFSDVNKNKKCNEISEKQKKYLELKKPEICGTIESTSNFVYNGDINNDVDINYQNNIIDVNKNNVNINNKNEIISNIYHEYYKKNLVYPNKNEILNELNEDIELIIIENFLENNNIV